MTGSNSCLRNLLVIGIATLTMSACSNPRLNPNGSQPINQPAKPNFKLITLKPALNEGDSYRTVRKLRVEEFTSSERFVVTSSEETLTTVEAVDDNGRALVVVRTWQSGETTLVKGYGKGETSNGELNGITLRLTQRSESCEAEVLAGELDMRGRQLFIEGMDNGLLPVDPVRQGDHWTLGSAKLSAFERFVSKLNFEVSSNQIDCDLREVTDSNAIIGVIWRISGLMDGRTTVLEFKGQLIYDRVTHLNTGFKLSGGRKGELGDSSTIEIDIQRKKQTNWLDLED